MQVSLHSIVLTQRACQERRHHNDIYRVYERHFLYGLK